MREKLETLSLSQLKELAKGAGLKNTSVLRKGELVDLLVKASEKEEKKKAVVKKTPGNKAVVNKNRTTETGTDRSSAEGNGTEAGQADPKKTESKKAEQKRPGTRKRELKRTEWKKPEPEKKPVKEEADSYENKPEMALEEPEMLPEETETTFQEDRPEENRPEEDRPEEDRPEEDRPEEDRTEEDRPEEDRPEENRSEENQPEENRSEENQPEENRMPDRLESVADRGPQAYGILEVMQDGFGFIRCENYLPGDNDVYVSPSQIRRFRLKTGDMITGSKRQKTASEKFAALLYVNTVNGLRPAEIEKRKNFEDMTPIFPDERIHLEAPGASTAMRVVDLISPIGKGQRGMIVSPPKAGKTTLLKQIAKVVTTTEPDMHVIILLIDERPEEVTDIREYIEGPQVEVIYSTFDELPERHKRVSEMVIERAKRLVEQHHDVIILLDSITRLSRAYNLTITPSGRTLSGGLDPAALYMPKRFFGAARNMREGGSLTVLATALVDTGSRMDDMVYEEFKGTGNMELVLDRKLSEKRIFPAVDILKSGTRRDDLLLSREERGVLDMIHKATSGNRPDDSVERILDLFAKTKSNADIIRYAKYNRF